MVTKRWRANLQWPRIRKLTIMAHIKLHALAIQLSQIADDEDLLGVAHKAIEDRLVEWRDMRLSTPLAANGLVIHEKDGRHSATIRMTPREAMRVGLNAIANRLTKDPNDIT